MSNQTHRKLADLAKKRRENLMKKSRANTMLCVGFILLLLFGVSTLFFGMATLYSLQSLTMSISSPLTAIISAIGMTAFCCPLAYFFGIRIMKKAGNDMAELRYVPPVRDQLAALPAEEILVRGSGQPAATPEELLRAARAGTADAREELLRANDLRAAQDQPGQITIEQRLAQ